jgi:putative antitoxin of VapBC-like toxin-antitoxin system
VPPKHKVECSNHSGRTTFLSSSFGYGPHELVNVLPETRLSRIATLRLRLHDASRAEVRSQAAPCCKAMHKNIQEWCMIISMRTNIDINESLVRKARKLTRLKTKRQIVDKALELLVRSESRKGILRYYGSGIWKGDPKAMRRNRV